MNTYTDTQLKQALAKMLPEQVYYDEKVLGGLRWKAEPYWRNVLTPELLHLCWLVEETLTESEQEDYVCSLETQAYPDGFPQPMYEPHWFIVVHATWQQRTIALAKVKGIEI